MLYECWRHIASAGRDQVALTDLANGRRWTFQELAAAVENEPLDQRPIIFPRGLSADFVLTVLRAWRANRLVCPLEPGQPAPEWRGDMPPGFVHLKTTSATTGTPRLIAFTAGQLVADAESIVGTMGLRPEWPNLGVISMAHSYGFSNLVLPLLLHGIPLVLVGATLPEALRRAAATGGEFTLAAVPALWRTWHEADAIPGNVRLAISAGAPLPLGVEQSVYAKRGLKIHNFYGSSECGGIAYDNTATPRLDDACVGMPMRDVSLSVAEDGCLEVRSRAVAETYWPEPRAELQRGVFHTSDLAEIAGDRVHLRGRAGDQINVAGRKVSPEAIERVLRTHPQVRQCLAFGVPSPEIGRGETVVACVAGDQPFNSEDLKQFLITKLPPWQVPREWWFVGSLEPNDRGKWSRAELRQRYLERRQQPVGRRYSPGHLATKPNHAAD